MATAGALTLCREFSLGVESDHKGYVRPPIDDASYAIDKL